MFNLVDKVEDYFEFLFWCGGVEVFECSDDSFMVKIKINYYGFK